MAGIEVPESARIILLPAEGAGTKDLLAKEKLCPVVAILPYKTFTEAVAAAKANLLVEGAGHSAAVLEFRAHSCGTYRVPISVRRQPGESFTPAGRSPTASAADDDAGCGSGGNSISENLDTNT
jgi:succinate-semialdehyde dehydrogenase